MDSFFYKSICVYWVKYYRENNSKKSDPIVTNSILGPNAQLLLNQFWVNYQYKTEFNPYHDHSEVYSFAIWFKIPYDWEEHSKLKQFNNMKMENIKPGNF